MAWRADGKQVLTGSDDNTARIWDAASGKPVGHPLEHKGPVVSVAWSPDGKQVLTGSQDGTARIWNLPPAIEGTPDRIALWVSVMTGSEPDEAGAIRVLDADAWRQRRQQLDQLGGPPLP